MYGILYLLGAGIVAIKDKINYDASVIDDRNRAQALMRDVFYDEKGNRRWTKTGDLTIKKLMDNGHTCEVDLKTGKVLVDYTAIEMKKNDDRFNEDYQKNLSKAKEEGRAWFYCSGHIRDCRNGTYEVSTGKRYTLFASHGYYSKYYFKYNNKNYSEKSEEKIYITEDEWKRLGGEKIRYDFGMNNRNYTI